MDSYPYVEKVKRIHIWTLTHPDFDPVFIIQMKEKLKCDVLTKAQEQSVDNIYYKWKIDRLYSTLPYKTKAEKKDIRSFFQSSIQKKPECLLKL